MGIAPHIARLRAFVGHEQLLLPCATVLPVDEQGRVLLAWAAGHTDGWGTVGRGDVLGGPDYEGTYPNGNRAAYVTAVYEASIVEGVPAPADGELSDVA